MKFSIISLVAALCLVSSIEAGITTKTPFKSVTWNGGNTEKVIWDDDGSSPTLDQIGLVSVDLMAGGDSVQIFVSNIGQVQATAKEVDYTVPLDVGPPDNIYFIKFTAGTYTSYSGTFSIAGVSGKLSGNPAPIPSNPAGTPTAPATPSISNPANANTTSTISNASNTPGSSPAVSPAAKSPFPTPLSSSSNAANLLPSFAGIATTALALILTHLY